MKKLNSLTLTISKPTFPSINLIKALFAVLFIGIFSTSTFANTPSAQRTNTNFQESKSLLALAMLEVQSPSQNTSAVKANSVDNQITGALTLEDPKKEVLNRSFNYTFAMKLSQLKLKGTVNNDVNETFDLNQLDAMMGPAMDFGIHQVIFQNSQWQLSTGLQLGLSYFNQEKNWLLKSGYQASNTNLNVYRGHVLPYLGVRIRSLPKLSLEVGPQWSQMNVIQNSQSEFSNFNTSLKMTGNVFRADYKLNQKWSVLAELQSVNKTQNSSNSKVSKDSNTSIGIKSAW